MRVCVCVYRRGGLGREKQQRQTERGARETEEKGESERESQRVSLCARERQGGGGGGLFGLEAADLVLPLLHLDQALAPHHVLDLRLLLMFGVMVFTVDYSSFIVYYLSVYNHSLCYCLSLIIYHLSVYCMSFIICCFGVACLGFGVGRLWLRHEALAPHHVLDLRLFLG